MSEANTERDPARGSASQTGDPAGPATVRYQVTNLDRAIAFYTKVLDFNLEMKSGSAFAMVSRAALHLILGGPGSSGARPMPDGRRQEPGGWNRIVLYVSDLETKIGELTARGIHFRNSVEVGPGGKQILVDDPDGNPIELHEGGASTLK